jgi:DUF971 family protein
MANDLPTDVKLHKKSGTLELVYSDELGNELSAEFLRVTADFGLYTPLLFFVFSG